MKYPIKCSKLFRTSLLGLIRKHAIIRVVKCLAIVRSGLEEVDFEVEKSKRNDELVAVPVLYGVNGRIDKLFEADGYLPSVDYVVEDED